MARTDPLLTYSVFCTSCGKYHIISPSIWPCITRGLPGQPFIKHGPVITLLLIAHTCLPLSCSSLCQTAAICNVQALLRFVILPRARSVLPGGVYSWLDQLISGSRALHMGHLPKVNPSFRLSTDASSAWFHSRHCSGADSRHSSWTASYSSHPHCPPRSGLMHAFGHGGPPKCSSARQHARAVFHSPPAGGLALLAV
jgi:hypothetical protein